MIVEHLNTAKSHVWTDTALAHLNNIATITADTTLGGQLRIFLLSCRVNELSPRTISDYADKIGAFVNFLTGQGIADPHEVTPNHVRVFLLLLRERMKAVSVHDYYGVVNRYFNWLIEEGVLNQSPMARMHPPRVPKEIIQPFSLDDIRRLLTLCDNKSFLGCRNRAIILMFLDTGLRLAEMGGIRLADIDFDMGIVKVMGKGRKERVARIGKETQKAILRYLLQRRDDAPTLWVTEERGPMLARGIQSMVKRLGKRARITDTRCSPHTFRHTFAITCLRNGVGELNLQCLLGHTTLQMTQRYVQSLGATDAIRAHEKASPVDNLRL